jgi:hypothetical protein
LKTNNLADLTTAVIRKDGPSSKPYCLHFSDGRKECFSSREQAQKREQQINFFKHRDSKGSGVETYVMGCLNILAEYSPVGLDSTIYLTLENDGDVGAFLARENEAGIEVFAVDEGFAEFDKYKPFAEAAMADFTTAQDQTRGLALSQAIIEGQMIVGSHTHKIEFGPNGLNLMSSERLGVMETSETEGHKHYVEYYDGRVYIAAAPVEVAGIRLMHTHMPVIKPKGDMNAIRT